MIDWAGRTIGNYRVESRLGRGGMGQVVRATHLHLNRTVAIKILHEQFADDPGFRARFQQEAQAAAALVHPNIVQVLDFGEQDGLLYLVMELVPDGSLRTLLRQSAGQPLPLSIGLDLIRQAAEGLAYAHAHRMVHRDVKPDNLLLTRRDSGYLLKVTDFGLARLAEGGVHTASGVTLGTPAYMSPEQCQGLDLDGRSDLYSLGIVLFEVVTSAVPFETRSLSDAVFKHVYTPPPSPRAMRPDLPEPLEAIILRCLSKQPAERFATAGELAGALAAQSLPSRVQSLSARTLPFQAVAPPATPVPSEPRPPDIGRPPSERELQAGGAGSPPSSAETAPEPSLPYWQATLIALLLLAGLGALLYAFVLNDDDDRDDFAAATATREATETATTGAEQETSAAAAVTAPATATATAPTTAPATAQPATETIVVIVPETQTPAPPIDRIVFATGRGQPDPNGYLDIYTMAPDGSDQQPLIVDAGDDWQPDWSPDRSQVAWVSKRNGNEDIYVANADGTDQRQLTDDPADDLFPSWSPEGTRIGFARNDELFVIDLRAGSATQLTANNANDGYPAWSPDGTQIAWTSGVTGNNEIWVMQADGSRARQATDDPANDFNPVWSPDGTSIVFVSDRAGNLDLFWIEAGGEPVALTSDPADESGHAWSPDGSRIAYLRRTGNNGDLIVMAPDGTNQQRLTGEVFGTDPDITWSPDGQQIAFSRLGEAYIDAWVINADGTGELRLTAAPYFDGNLDW
jgi:serine/threonine protein kinase/Tol biopolymer transport system component